MAATLYQGKLGPNAKRVRIAARELGVALDHALVDFQAGAHHAPAYLALNPNAKVPTIVDAIAGGDDAFVLWESSAILWYLASATGASALWPAEHRAQADVLRWMFWGACHLDGSYTTLVIERFLKGRTSAVEDAAVTAFASGQLPRFFAVLDGQLAGRAFVTGATFTLADITLGTTLELSRMLGLDLAPFPAIGAWLARVQARPSWLAAADDLKL